MRDAASDSEARAVLDELIDERVVAEEAASRKLSVSDAEVSEYVEEVARRNGLSGPDFEEALAAEGKTVTDYRAKVRSDILKSKLSSADLRGAVSVSDEEIEEQLRSAGPGTAPGTRVRVRRVFLPAEGYHKDRAVAFLRRIKEEVEENGIPFEDLARSYSKGPEAVEGGDMGEIAEKDLSPHVFDALLSLREGDTSVPVVTEEGYSLFQLISRSEPDPEERERAEKARRDSVRKELEQRKLESRLADYFTEELQTRHSVDRKM